MRNIKLTIQYNGKNYCGWQKQNDSLGIQGTIEQAIKEITKEDIKINGSGRTDAGVHALGQVANFNTDCKIPVDKIPNALNSKLPEDIAIINAEEKELNFHSRHCAKGKRYRYMIYNSIYRSPIYNDIAYFVKYDLDFEKMEEEAKTLIGTHDFKGFMSSGSSVVNTVRTIYDIKISKQEELIIIEVEGNGFLYNMVRILVGTLVDIGRGRIDTDMLSIIKSKTRSMAGHTAPAHGLFLKKVDY
ncbi:MAG: tRNA pseudouridine(38-40) synthase TruA [Terrisporobacter sp.]